MGCIQSSDKVEQPAAKSEPARSAPVPKYVTADPDLGWRNISERAYPLMGFGLAFQNERSGTVINDLNLINLALNVARRAADLADKYGVTDARDLQSQMNMLDPMGDATQSLAADDIDRQAGKIMKHFGCPRFRWKLKSRLEETSTFIRGHPEIFLQPHALVEDRQALSQLAAVPDYLQVMTDQDGQICILDVAEIGMNIAEQLFRLEKSESQDASLHKVPDDMFGWRIMDPMTSQPHVAKAARAAYGVPVISPEQEALMLIPEELIMNVASWVQATYLTAPAF